MATAIIVTGSSLEKRQERVRDILAREKILTGNTLTHNEDKKGIREVREWTSWLNITSGENKALWISNAGILTLEAQNAFLKILEEPPENTLIVLEVQNIETLLPTVISRCLVVDTGLTSLELNNQSKDKLKLQLKMLDHGIDAKFALAQKLALGRTDAISWIDEMLSYFYQQGLISQNGASKVKALLVAKRQLNSNTSVRLTLENLFLNW